MNDLASFGDSTGELDLNAAAGAATGGVIA
jgi:hypothetical protein